MADNETTVIRRIYAQIIKELYLKKLSGYYLNTISKIALLYFRMKALRIVNTLKTKTVHSYEKQSQVNT